MSSEHLNISNFFRNIVLIGIPIVMWNCYWYVGFNQEYTKLLVFIVSFILLAIVGVYLLRRKSIGYERYVKWILVLFLISLATSYFYWGQSPILTFRAGVGILTILYFFVLKKCKVTGQELFILVSFFSVVYLVLWLYALSMAPIPIFGNLETVSEDRGFYRILQLNSVDTVCILFFISFVQAIYSSKRIKWILLSLGCFIIIFLTMSRMLIASILVISTFFLLKKRFFIAVLVSGLLFFGYDQLLRSDIVMNMINMTENQISNKNESDLRLVEYENAFTAFPFNIGTTIFGNGAAHVESDYGKYNENLKQTKKFHTSDAGYVGLYVQYGTAMLILFAFLFLKVARSKVPIQYQPYRLFIFSLFITNITSYVFFRYGISFAMSLYAMSLADKIELSIIQKKGFKKLKGDNKEKLNNLGL